jgi:pyruvate dehydrogenase E2 component (dihydrolipoamide acetyltransferase)/2-oxoisovalerate dehydrogenase E2 component (dihydrolipoyl transacylase)
MPDIGEGVVEGEVITWLKAINEPVGQDEPVVVLMTDKATVELPSPHPGKIARHYYNVGDIAQRDKPLYDIELSDTLSKAPKILEPSPVVPPVPEKQKDNSTEEKKESGLVARKNDKDKDKVLAIPSVRHTAREMGIDISAVSGSGKEGRVTLHDLQEFVSKGQKPAPQDRCAKSTASARLEGDEVLPMVGIRGLMAKKMQETHANVPQFSYFEQADATRLIQLKKKINEAATKEGIKVTYMPFFLRALSLTIGKFPELNSSFDAGNRQLIIHKQQNIGIAMASASGLIVPVLKNVQDMNLEQLVKAYENLKKQAEAGSLHSSDMKEGTITISNFGGLAGGGLWATPIIYYPEVAILAVARIQKQAMVHEGQLAVKDMLNLSWTFDHRIIDGEAAALYSHHFVKLINNPAELL